mmetsp:Transcript_32514/g.100623  ORF Transcript_32514/g.100623 Transcript_32514/m.100623 type:complete len:81 (-) Transcript_32514:286-528(-)
MRKPPRRSTTEKAKYRSSRKSGEESAKEGSCDDQRDFEAPKNLACLRVIVMSPRVRLENEVVDCSLGGRYGVDHNDELHR